MKLSLAILALVLTTSVCFAQSSTDTVKNSSDTARDNQAAAHQKEAERRVAPAQPPVEKPSTRSAQQHADDYKNSGPQNNTPKKYTETHKVPD